jgi:cold shock CspA family protein
MIDRRIGVVRNFFHDRGFGFVRVLEDGKPARVDRSLPDVFIHAKELRLAGIHRVESGDTLEFDVTEFPKGLVASKIAVVQ